MITSRLGSSLILACSLLLARPALADELEQARATFTLGEAHLEAHRYAEASAAFENVLKVVEVPAVAFKAAQANEKQGKLLSARQLYTLATQLEQNRFWADKRTQLQAQRDASAALQALEGRIPTLELELRGELDAIKEVAIDGHPLARSAFATPQPLDPGSHVVRVTTRDGRTSTETVMLAESEHKTVTLELTRAASPANAVVPPAPVSPIPPPAGSPTMGVVFPAQTNPAARSERSTQQWAAYASLGIGAAGLVLGTTAGLIALSKYSNIKSQCGGGRDCEANVYDRLNPSYETWQTVSTVGFIAAGVGAATGVTLLLVRPKHSAVPQASVTVGAGSLVLAGAF